MNLGLLHLSLLLPGVLLEKREGEILENLLEILGKETTEGGTEMETETTAEGN